MEHGAHLLLWLWLLAAGAVIVFNLDAAVVLLTPLYIRVAQRHELDPVVLAFQRALLACLASNPLPVSKLTNLIAAERLDLGVGEFLTNLGPMTLVTCTAGWFAYARRARRVPSTAQHEPMHDEGPADGRALRLGLPISGFVLVGFTFGNALGIPAWIVAAVATGWAIALVRQLPWRTVPIGAMLVAAALAVSAGRCRTCTSTSCSTPADSPGASVASASGRSAPTRPTTSRRSSPARPRCTTGPRCGRSWRGRTWPRSS